jgi:hypothetical protein
MLALAAVVLAAVLPMVWEFGATAWVVTLLVIALHALTLDRAFRFTRAMSPLAMGVFVILIFIVLWAGPLVIDVARLATLRIDSGFSIISTISPMGLLIAAWDTGPGESPPVVYGLVAQAGFCGLVWWMAGRRKRRAIGASLQPAST